jgi:hypothetical protein
MPPKKKVLKPKKKPLPYSEKAIKETAIREIIRIHKLVSKGEFVSDLVHLNTYRRIRNMPSLYNELMRNPLLAEKMKLIEEKEKNRL